MISLETARALKSAGLEWHPALHDFFAIPDRTMDERVFVISDMLATVDFIQGRRVVAFQGASEWALDNLAIGEVVWLPREDQVRGLIESALLERGQPNTRLDGSLGGYTCTVNVGNQALSFHAREAAEAYGLALLHLIQASAVQRSSPNP